MSGEAYAITCAFCWAMSSALIKSQVAKIPVVVLNALQAVPAALIFWGLLLFSGRIGQFLELPLYAWGFLAGSTLMSLVIGYFLFRFQYHARFGDAGCEHELCAVYAGRFQEPFAPNPTEIEAVRWISPEDLDRWMAADTGELTPWFRAEWARIRAEHWHTVQDIIALP